MEHQAEEQIRHAVDQQFVSWIVDDGAAANKAGAKYCIPPFVEKLPVPDDIPAIVRLIGHHDDHRLALAMVNPVDNGPAKAIFGGVLDWPECWDPATKALEDRPG